MKNIRHCQADLLWKRWWSSFSVLVFAGVLQCNTISHHTGPDHTIRYQMILQHEYRVILLGLEFFAHDTINMYIYIYKQLQSQSWPHLFHRLRWPDLVRHHTPTNRNVREKSSSSFWGWCKSTKKSQTTSIYVWQTDARSMCIYIYTNIISMSISILSESKLEFLKRTLFVLSKQIIPIPPQSSSTVSWLNLQRLSYLSQCIQQFHINPSDRTMERAKMPSLCVGSLSSEGIPMTRYQWIFRKLQQEITEITLSKHDQDEPRKTPDLTSIILVV